ncbi:MAG: hypothetical protein R3C99_12670 [Pirellulaceae bacterium]
MLWHRIHATNPNERQKSAWRSACGTPNASDMGNLKQCHQAMVMAFAACPLSYLVRQLPDVPKVEVLRFTDRGFWICPARMNENELTPDDQFAMPSFLTGPHIDPNKSTREQARDSFGFSVESHFNRVMVVPLLTLIRDEL